MSGWTNLRAIVSGFKNYHFPNAEIEKIAKERAKICASCPYANPEHPFKLLLDDNRTQEIKGMGCNICGCLLSAKTRQLLNDCPEGKWDKKDTNNLLTKNKNQK